MNILAIDPGNRESAYVLYDSDTGKPTRFGKVDNGILLECIRNNDYGHDGIVIERVACMGMAVGEEVFETVLWSGRFIEACDRDLRPWHRVKRHEVKMHLCGNMRAKDPNIRQALIDRFGPGREAAIGTKKAPGPLYGVSADVWAALAVAVVWSDRHAQCAAGGHHG